MILKTQIKKGQPGVELCANTEHTPGFYRLETFRLGHYSAAMDKKLKAAVSRHDRANRIMARCARMAKPDDIQNRAFLRLIASDNRVTHARKLSNDATSDLTTTCTTAVTTNKIADVAYKLAYSSKLELLKYQLSKLRTK